MEITSDTRIIDLTVGQLMDLFAKAQAPATQAQQKEEKRLVYGIAGIAQIFNCSMTTANRIKVAPPVGAWIKTRKILLFLDIFDYVFHSRYESIRPRYRCLLKLSDGISF